MLDEELGFRPDYSEHYLAQTVREPHAYGKNAMRESNV